MILVFGGTTEGRIAIDTLTEGGKPFYYSTRGEQQKVEEPLVQRITGAMDAPGIEEFCRTHEIRLIIDAAPPLGQKLT